MKHSIIILAVFWLLSLNASAQYVNILTQKRGDLPKTAVSVSDKVYPRGDLEQWAEKGWRKPIAEAKAPEGFVIQSVTWVQDEREKYGARAELVLKSLAEVEKESSDAEAARKAAEQKAAEDLAAAEAARLAERDSIVKAFPDEKQAAALAALFDLIRPPLKP